eukprot:CAMPEP_0115376306 /NCGR_PEP_ID=MMETSP0271-20121206/2909_1 /TAXON_ID=71861 /ORGANISM="Scrippsiella trochoidea, Strain CCMP3099" /LENGTH=90 /DNA_ID=CAMNT_0002799395 /DNA_START=5 /DNA_END=273 /DNA_ORIENTATION=-
MRMTADVQTIPVLSWTSDVQKMSVLGAIPLDGKPMYVTITSSLQRAAWHGAESTYSSTKAATMNAGSSKLNLVERATSTVAESLALYGLP